MTAIANDNSGAKLAHIISDQPTGSDAARIRISDHVIILTRKSRDEVIWPTWPANTSDVQLAGSPLAELERDWLDVGRRLRESAKWMSTVLGAALGTIVGASPLADLEGHHMQVTTIVILFAGLALLSVTMLLILRIMQSGAVSYESVQNADPSVGLATTVRKLFRRNKPDSHFLENPLHQWRRTVTAHKDLYLPCRVNSLRDLRHAMEDEEETLRQLADAANHPGGELTGDLLAKVQAARVARLLELRMAAARITSVGEGYVLRARCTVAMYGASITGLLGTAAIILAFAWPIG
jgi:hypothetical protein